MLCEVGTGLDRVLEIPFDGALLGRISKEFGA